MHAAQQSEAGLEGAASGLLSALSVLLPTAGRLPCLEEPCSLARVGSSVPCLQCWFQPWLTRVRARPCYPPLQDVRPRNCLQLQTVRPTGTRAKLLPQGRGICHPALSARFGGSLCPLRLFQMPQALEGLPGTLGEPPC